jgi:hypothetical protein
LKTIGIVGSRRRKGLKVFQAIESKVLELYEDGDIIVSGGCPEGADSYAEIISRKHQIPIMIHYARWNKLGKQAGFARNTNIAKDCDILIATVASDRTGGTEDTIRKTILLDKEIILL